VQDITIAFMEFIPKKTNITGGSIFIGAMFFIGKKT
jgi:hypothetical protein